MTGFRAAMIALTLILPIAALVARRPAWRPLLGMALAWVAVFAAGYAIVSLVRG